jgi:hypothetical protein
LATSSTPHWTAENLRLHHKTRLREDPGCFEDLLGLVGRVMRESEYELRSEAAFTNSWAEYEGEGRDVQTGDYYDRAAYFVDDVLVVAITDTFRREFITCYHKHFRKPHGVDPRPGMTVGQLQLRYRDWLKDAEKGKLIRKLRRIRGV